MPAAESARQASPAGGRDVERELFERDTEIVLYGWGNEGCGDVLQADSASEAYSAGESPTTRRKSRMKWAWS